MLGRGNFSGLNNCPIILYYELTKESCTQRMALALDFFVDG